MFYLGKIIIVSLEQQPWLKENSHGIDNRPYLGSRDSDKARVIWSLQHPLAPWPSQPSGHRLYWPGWLGPTPWHYLQYQHRPSQARRLSQKPLRSMRESQAKVPGTPGTDHTNLNSRRLDYGSSLYHSHRSPFLVPLSLAAYRSDWNWEIPR